MLSGNVRPFGGIAVYSRMDYYPGYPYSCNSNGIEIIAVRLMTAPNIHTFGIYRPPKVPVAQICHALFEPLTPQSSQLNAFMGDFNVNWLNNKDNVCLHNSCIRDHSYKQLVSCYTIDDRICIDHIYTNMPISVIRFQMLETDFTDHKSVCALIQPLNLPP